VRLKRDERILGDSDFVENVVKSASEALDEKYELKARSYGFNRVISRMAESMGLTPCPEQNMEITLVHPDWHVLLELLESISC